MSTRPVLSEADVSSLLDRMTAIATEIEEPLRCTTPAYGAPGYAHCAACCYGTGFIVTCDDEQAMLDAAKALRHAVRLLAMPARRVSDPTPGDAK